MCGIAGLIGRTEGDAERRVDAALRSLAHRGPDGQAFISSGPCVLGQTRLAIIDLSPAGQEPFENESGSMWLTFNGEIYNFEQLRSELEAAGHVFRSRTDAEVVLHGYEEWGTGVLERLRGMFAFAIWDESRSQLMLARDRLGKKPLFYSLENGGLRFASELQGLLAMGGHSPEVDISSIDAYLTWGYVPAPWSGFKGIVKLPPGHFLIVEAGEREITTWTERYWSLDYLPKLRLSDEEASDRLRSLLTEAVRLRLVSDVPLGAFLSGGIDSSIVVGLMAELSADPVKTFSIGFEEQSFSELEHARRIAEMWGTDHHELVVKPDALEVLPLLARHYGEPFADSSAIPTYYVAKMTREHVTVALNGDGGDESFAGYERYRANAIAERVGGVPGGPAALGFLAKAVPDSDDQKSRLRKIKRFSDALGMSQAQRYGRWSGYFLDQERKELFQATVTHDGDGYESMWFHSLFEEAAGLDAVDAAMSVDVRSYLPFDLLVKVDIASMANSLEARSPFLDHEVMEFAARLPSNLKLRRGKSKWILRNAFSDLLPKENVARPKMGFAVPVGAWLRGPLTELLKDTLLAADARVGAYLDLAAVGRVVERHQRGEELSSQVWSLLMLEMWHREVVDKMRST